MAGVSQARAAFDDYSHRAGLPEFARWRFQVALDEILSNVVRHGLMGVPGAVIELAFASESGVVCVEITDSARAFNPLEAPAPDTTSSLDERVPGGLGIALVSSLMDEVHYERRGDRNYVTMKWRVRDASPAGTDR